MNFIRGFVSVFNSAELGKFSAIMTLTISPVIAYFAVTYYFMVYRRTK